MDPSCSRARHSKNSGASTKTWHDPLPTPPDPSISGGVVDGGTGSLPPTMVPFAPACLFFPLSPPPPPQCLSPVHIQVYTSSSSCWAPFSERGGDEGSVSQATSGCCSRARRCCFRLLTVELPRCETSLHLSLSSICLCSSLVQAPGQHRRQHRRTHEKFKKRENYESLQHGGASLSPRERMRASEPERFVLKNLRKTQPIANTCQSNKSRTCGAPPKVFFFLKKKNIK